MTRRPSARRCRSEGHDAEEALTLANDSPYGSAARFSGDARAASSSRADARRRGLVNALLNYVASSCRWAAEGVGPRSAPRAAESEFTKQQSIFISACTSRTTCTCSRTGDGCQGAVRGVRLIYGRGRRAEPARGAGRSPHDDRVGQRWPRSPSPAVPVLWACRTTGGLKSRTSPCGRAGDDYLASLTGCRFVAVRGIPPPPARRCSRAGRRGRRDRRAVGVLRALAIAR